MRRGGPQLGKETKKAIDDEKKIIIKKAKEPPLGLLLDSPNGGGHGGSTDGANNSRKFFSQKNREHVLNLFKVDVSDRAKIERIIRDINVIGRVANSTKLIDVAKFKEFCKEAYIFKVKAFSWPSLPTTLHRGYAHLGQNHLLTNFVQNNFPKLIFQI